MEDKRTHKPPREIVVISGKGGTGKTSLVGAFAALCDKVVVADVDVDAPDLHLLLAPEIQSKRAFVSGKQARVRPELCKGCGLCAELCRFDAVGSHGSTSLEGASETYRVHPMACEGCGVCAWFCPEGAIAFEPVRRGEWFRSLTRFGSMVHARMDVGAENSGKLVTLLRNEARNIAVDTGCDLILCDGSPGIGCPVIASVTNANLVVVVTEATLSGKHDMERVLRLARGFGLKTAVCVNRADIAPEMADQVEAGASQQGAVVLPRVPYDPAILHAQQQGLTIVEFPDSPSARAIARCWSEICKLLDEPAD
jgi:MinD superfamily P-loop ATPase